MSIIVARGQLTKKQINIIIPAYNEERRINRVLKDICQYKLPVIVVDDGSTDNTSKIALKYKIVLLRRRINLGGSKGAALKTGVEYAFDQGADAVLLIDSDGQHLSRDIPKFINKINKGYDVVIGTRNFNLNVPIVRYIGNKIASVMINIMFGIYVSDLLCGFRAITKRAYENIKWESIGYGVETEMIVNLSKTKLKWCEVPVTVLYHDKIKGVSLLDSFGILFDVIKWRILK